MKIILKILTASCTILILLSLPARASGGPQISFPENDIAAGVYGAWTGSGHKGLAAGIDMSLSYFLFSGGFNLKYMKTGSLEHMGIQTEFTVWLLLNIGGGAGYLWGDDPGPVYHIFAGFPWGDDFTRIGPFHTEYVEPYYRLNFFRHELYHEVGVMLKVTTYTF